jgi:signal recognition particle subunit SEC65
MSTADHLKRMAAATHLETSQQGKPVPLLRLEVRYTESHFRTRAIDADMHYTASIGANDLAEAVLQIGQVVRWGETMHARKLRKVKSEALPAGRLVRLTDEQIATIKESLKYSAHRIRDSHYPGEDYQEAAARKRDSEERFASVREALASPPKGDE